MTKTDIEKIREARKVLMPYGYLKNNREAHDVANLCSEAEREDSIYKELLVLHMLFRNPPNLLRGKNA